MCAINVSTMCGTQIRGKNWKHETDEIMTKIATLTLKFKWNLRIKMRDIIIYL